jgi:hypothetical protein
MRNGAGKTIAGVLAVGLMAGVCRAGWIVDGSPSVWIGAAVATPADAYTYPVFHIPLGGNWTDFELKASTGNFSSNRVYWVASSFDTATNSAMGDTNVWVHFTDNYANEVLAWRKATNAAPIWGQLLNTASSVVEYVVVQPSHACETDWAGWMSRTNDRLVWVYTRYDGIELDTHWTPIVPVAWRTARVAP